MVRAKTVCYGRVEQIADGRPVVCVGTGASLTAEDVAVCRDRACVLAVKDAVRLATWADVLYSGEIRWWRQYGPALTFAGARYTLEPEAEDWATVLRNTGPLGLEPSPDGLRTGSHSGYQAINLAVHLGASRIVLLGYDMQATNGQDHFFGAHPYEKRVRPYQWVSLFAELVAPLKSLGIPIVNASRVTAISCFPRQDLAEALS